MTAVALHPSAPAPPARLPHQPALDGLRGVAVAGVVAFHLGHLRGGFLGVDLFFTLSGYLITRLLLLEHAARGDVQLTAFWARRARRLLPAMYTLLAVMAVYAALFARPHELAGIRGPGLAALAYVANWWFIATGNGYWDEFTGPSPLEHVWSLSIEEQFYVVWPLAVLWVLGRAGRVGRLGTAIVPLTLASTVAMAVLAGDDPSRAYLGTFTRAGSILVGAFLAVVFHRRAGRTMSAPAERSLSVAAIAASAFLVWAWVSVDGTDPAWYRGGFLAHAVAVAVVIAATTEQPAGGLARGLAVAPLRWLGLVSYGLYLWHWPVFVILDGARTGLDGATLLTVRLAVALALTVASYVLIERPIRSGAITGRWAWAAAPAVAAGLAVLLVAATVPVRATPVAGAPPPITAGTLPPEAAAPGTPSGSVTTDKAEEVPSSPGVTAPPPLLQTTPAAGLPLVRTPTPADPLRVLLVGDSYLYDASPGIEAALEATGVVEVTPAGRVGFSLTHEGWDATLRELVAAHRPELVIAMWARFDADWMERNDPLAYEALLDEAVAVLTGGGAPLAFVGLAPSLTGGIDPVPVDRGINTLFVELPTRFPGRVVYVDPDPVVAPTGEPDRWLVTPEGRLLVRKADGSHYCGDGAARFGLAMSELVHRMAEVVPADPATWWLGEWRADGRYDDPPGACA